MNPIGNVLIAIFLLLSQAHAASLPLEARHQVSGLNSQFNGDQLAFADYVARKLSMTRFIDGLP